MNTTTNKPCDCIDGFKKLYDEFKTTCEKLNPDSKEYLEYVLNNKYKLIIEANTTRLIADNIADKDKSKEINDLILEAITVAEKHYKKALGL